jgi:hypothetical protein
MVSTLAVLSTLASLALAGPLSSSLDERSHAAALVSPNLLPVTNYTTTSYAFGSTTVYENIPIATITTSSPTKAATPKRAKTSAPTADDLLIAIKAGGLQESGQPKRPRNARNHQKDNCRKEFDVDKHTSLEKTGMFEAR